MDKILDKLGVYDLFVNFITGLTMLCIFGYLQNTMLHFEQLQFLDKCKNVPIWVILLFSYFVGIVFQETSNFFETMLYRATYDFENKKFKKYVFLLLVPSIDRVLLL